MNNNNNRFTELRDSYSSDSASDNSEPSYGHSDSDAYSDSDVSIDDAYYKTRTENNSATYKTTQNPNLDFFFHVTPDTSPQTLISKLESSWAHDPLTTFKLICNLRGIRDTGKSDKESFYKSALWLHNNHANTILCNTPVLVEFGYFKDLLEILYRIIQGEDVRKEAKRVWTAKKISKGKGLARKSYFLNKKKEQRKRKEKERGRRGGKNSRRNTREDKGKSDRFWKTREERVEENRKQMEKNRYEAKKLRKEKESAMKEKLNDRYGSDQGFKMLHDQVSTFFAGV